tara:strand:- start:233 stop:718 length:486 start_codon:yes stop_codon:yes gene_type:complete
MANNVKQIIDELNTIATAFSSVNTFHFGLLSDINTDVNKSYPMVQVDSSLSSINRDSFSNYLPKEKEYSFDVYIWDLYQITEQKTKTKQEKYSDLEIISDQYIAEVMRRTLGQGGALYILNDEDLNGSYVSNAHNDKLIGIKYTIVFRSNNVGCTLGTFTY